MSAFWHRISFKYQLVGALALVTLLALVTVYILADRAIQDRFTEFSRRATTAQARQLQKMLVAFYRHNQSWEGLEVQVNSRVWGVELPREQPLLIADERGRVFISNDERMIGRQLSARDLEAGLPILAPKERFGRIERVGTLLMGLPPRVLSPLEDQFLQSVHSSILLAGSIALIIALGLGFLLVRRLSQPLTQLQQAAEQISHGRLAPRVQVAGSDELGHLGRTFNQMADSLQRSEDLRRQMIADIAHELRTPLMVQQSHLELMLDDVTEPSAQQLQTIYEQNLLLGRLVRDLQELAVAEAGELRIERKSVSLRDLLEGIAQHVRPALAEKEIQLQLGLPEELPALALDRQRIEQVLFNLLENARRYTPAGGTIRLGAELQGQQVQVSVTDEGPGVTEAELPQLFERLYRADPSRSRRSGGTGLGLAIAKHLVEAHGGRLWAEASAPGQGAVFRFTLPVDECF